jgi:NAD(P)-dependent dehydrogenase (short-subunit alcohol dehydrogenase family)
MELEHKTAIVTGGARRLGRAMALSLARKGVHICLHYGRSVEAAEETCEQIRQLGSQAVSVSADLRGSQAAAETILTSAVEAFGHADILVNSAALFEPGGVEDTTEESWNRQLETNLKAPFFLSQAFAKQRDHQRRGHIVNLVDWRATRPGPGHLAYTLTKSGLVTLTRILAQELAPDIQVNAIAPGAILPPAGSDDAYLNRLAENIPLKRTGAPDDISQALVFLLESDFITGEVLHVTGGEEL